MHFAAVPTSSLCPSLDLDTCRISVFFVPRTAPAKRLFAELDLAARLRLER